MNPQASRISPSPSQPACEFKGSRFTLSVLHLYSTDPEAIGDRLATLLSQAPGFLDQAPVIVDVSQLATPEALDLDGLTALLHQRNLIPIALRGGKEALQKQAVSTGLALMPDAPASASSGQTSVAANDQKPDRADGNRTHIVTRPVRSGQQIYAENADLVILGPVSAGAEVIADGSIHVYGALRGRALAGAHGHEGAHIFCQSLQAELLSIAGCYRAMESQPEETSSSPAHVWLEGERLMIDRL